MTFITETVGRDSLIASLNNIIMLILEWEDRGNNYPKQKIYWDNRIKEVEKALEPLLKDNVSITPEGHHVWNQTRPE